MPTTWEELVASVTAWVLVPASQSDDWERLVEQAVG
jgi:hypothetical protein